MWAIIFVLSNGTTATLNVPDAIHHRLPHCLQYGEAVIEIFNAHSETLKIISGQCRRRA